MTKPPEKPEPASDSMTGLLSLALRNFGKDVVIALVFSCVLGLAGRQIYRDLIASNNMVVGIAKDRAKNDEELALALQELRKEIEGTNAIIAERVRELREAERRGAERAANPNK